MPVNSFDNYPMNWKPVIHKSSMPIYQALARQLENDISTGVLTPGCKLPPQRELADFLDINLSTVTRAYKLCEQRGLICSAVGNGTYVSSDAATRSLLLINSPYNDVIEMGAILPGSEINAISANYLKEMSGDPDFYKQFQYASNGYDPVLLNAAVKWLEYSALPTSPDRIIYSSGSQNAIFGAIASLFSAGDKVATTSLTYPGLKVAAKILGIQLVPINTEDGQLEIDTLEYTYKNCNIKGLYIISDFNNPTSDILTLESRQAVANFCDFHDIPVIEDSIYSFFVNNPLPPISALTTKHGIFISSTSKILAPGLRLAIISAPDKYYEILKECIYAMLIAPPLLIMQLFARLVLSGRFNEIRQLRIENTNRRNVILKRIFPEFADKINLNCPFFWLTLKKDVNPDEFEKLALENGVQVSSASRFIVGPTPVPHAVRLSLISATLDSYQKGLDIIRALVTA